MTPTLSSLGGFIVGFGSVLVIAFIYLKQGKKKHKFDERYETVHAKARTISWGITIILLAILWLFALIYEGPKLAFILLTTAYAMLLLSYYAAVFIINRRN